MNLEFRLAIMVELAKGEYSVFLGKLAKFGPFDGEPLTDSLVESTPEGTDCIG